MLCVAAEHDVSHIKKINNKSAWEKGKQIRRVNCVHAIVFEREYVFEYIEYTQK